MLRLDPRSWFGSAPAPSWTPQGVPGPARGLISWLRTQVGGWLGPTLSRGTEQEEFVTSEKAASGPRGIVLPWFLPYIDDYTGETQQIRLAYRKMLADPHVKAALLGKLLAVAALTLKILPADKTNPRDRAIAEHVQWNLTERVRGCIPELIWAILSGGLVDGYSVCEKVFALEDQGRYAGKYALTRLKPKDTGSDIVLQTDEHRNVVGVMGLRYNAGIEFSPSEFLIYRHLPLFDSPTGMSDLRAAYSRYWMLDTVYKLRGLHASKRAMPVLLGTYNNPAVKSSLEKALASAKSQGWITAPEGAKVEALNIAGAAESDFKSFVEDLKHDIFLSIQGAVLQTLEGDTTDGRGNSQVHRSTADLFVWYLSETVAALLNDRDGGLIRDLVDLNYVVSEYPRAVLSAVDTNELAQEIQIDTGLKQLGLDLSKEEIYERYGRTPPKDDEDRLPGGPPGGPGGPSGAPMPGSLPFAEPNGVERFCMEGENAHLPGPCPADGGQGDDPELPGHLHRRLDSENPLHREPIPSWAKESNAYNPEAAPHAEGWVKMAAKLQKFRRDTVVQSTYYGPNHIALSGGPGDLQHQMRLRLFLQEALRRQIEPYREGWQVTIEEAKWLGLTYGEPGRNSLGDMLKNIAKRNKNSQHAEPVREGPAQPFRRYSERWRSYLAA